MQHQRLPSFVAIALDAIQSKANRAASDARSSANRIEDLTACRDFYIGQGAFSPHSFEQKIQTLKTWRDQGRRDDDHFRILHRRCLTWIDSLPDGTVLIVGEQDIASDDPARVLGCAVAQPLRAA